MLSRCQELTCRSNSDRFQRRREPSCQCCAGLRPAGFRPFSVWEMLVTAHTVLAIRAGLAVPCHCKAVQVVAGLTRYCCVLQSLVTGTTQALAVSPALTL